MSAKWPSVVALLLLCAASPLWAGPFSEVPSDHWAYRACTALVAADVLSATTEAGFTGDPQLTRFEFGLALLEPLSGLDRALGGLPDAADEGARLRAATRALGITPRASEEEIASVFSNLRRLTIEFSDVLRSLNFDSSSVVAALRGLGDSEAVRSWRVKALARPAYAVGLASGSAPDEAVRVPLAHGRVALSLTNPENSPELLDYLATAAAAAQGENGLSPGAAEPALADPRVSRLRTAYEYGLGSALTLSLAYEEIERRGQGFAALDAASLASLGIGYKLSRSASVKLSYSLLEYSNYALDAPPLRDRVAETAVSIEF